MKRSVTEYPLAGKRVLMRVDFNVPLVGASVADDTRIKAALPTLQYLLDQGCSIVLVTHLGRPNGQVVAGLRMDPVAARLAELLGQPVKMADECIGERVEARAAALAPGEILLLENVRFYPQETANDPEFARQLASLADVYVNDAFGCAHRAHASTEGVAHLLPALSGLLMQRELEMLGALLSDPEHPFVVVLGGSKVTDKIGVIERLLPIADAILIGGAMCFPLLKAAGHAIGNSKLEMEALDIAGELLAKISASPCEFLLPVDLVVAAEPVAETPSSIVFADAIPADMMGLDIGPETIAAFAERIGSARTLFWNGPMGLFEVDEFARGTESVGRAISASEAISIAGGGDTVRAIQQFAIGAGISHISTGGGASMEYLEGKALPGVAALLDS